MRKLGLLILAMAILIGGPAWSADNVLHIYNWSEYMDEEKMPVEFEKKFGIKVRLDFFESLEEAVAKLQAGGKNQYDVFIPADYMMPSSLALKLYQPLDHSKLPNLKNVMPKFRGLYFDPDNKYSVPYQWGTMALIYRKDKIKEADAQSWSLLFDPKKLAGPFYLLDSQQEMLALTMNYLGYDPSSTKPAEMKKAIELLVKSKKRNNCLGFKGGVGAKNEVVAGTAWAAIAYMGDALRAQAEDPKNIGVLIPQEGAFMYVDSMAIPVNAPNPDAAYKWINWLLEPKIGAWLSNYNKFPTPNEAALPYIDKEDRKNPNMYPSPEVMKKLFLLKDPGENMKILDQAWTRIKSQ